MSDQGAMRDHWYPVGMTKQLTAGGRDTLLMGEPIRVFLDNGAPAVTDGTGRSLPVIDRFGHVWTSLGAPNRDLFTIPEADQPGRRLVDVGVCRVRCSPLRAVENFLDIAPYMADARAGELPLLGGNYGKSSPYGFHDWEFILGETGLLAWDKTLAALTLNSGRAIMVLAMVWGAWLLWRGWRRQRG